MTQDSPLGKNSLYPDTYAPELLHAIDRAEARRAWQTDTTLPFVGEDIWNAWELTWLAADATPVVASAELRVPANSPALIESKSLKLYLNSFAMTTFASAALVSERIQADLGECLGCDVAVTLNPACHRIVDDTPGRCLDELSAPSSDDVSAEILSADENNLVHEYWYTHLLRSLCPVTGQPDLGSLLIEYEGPQIEPSALLRYIVSYRTHQDFHEACVEQIFCDLLAQCKPAALHIQARYQRRGGIDINPFRSTQRPSTANLRLWRQ